MRRLIVALVLIAVAGLAAAGTAGGHHSVGRVGVAGVSIDVPPGWRVLHGWLSDVMDPAPRLGMASFPAKLSRHTCECGSPNVVHFARSGALMFVWEYLHPSQRQLARTPRRPAPFSLTAGGRVHRTCHGPTDGLYFKQAGRVFQVEIYLGPKAGRALKAQMTSALDSLHATAGA